MRWSVGHDAPWGRRRGFSVGTPARKDRRHRYAMFPFVHQVPSDCEEHEKDGDDDPNIDAEHLNSPFARPGSFIVVPIAATSRGRPNFWDRYAERNMARIDRAASADLSLEFRFVSAGNILCGSNLTQKKVCQCKILIRFGYYRSLRFVRHINRLDPSWLFACFG
jgi:hypothetical protein